MKRNEIAQVLFTSGFIMMGTVVTIMAYVQDRLFGFFSLSALIMLAAKLIK